jgi:hypothetical protein
MKATFTEKDLIESKFCDEKQAKEIMAILNDKTTHKTGINEISDRLNEVNELLKNDGCYGVESLIWSDNNQEMRNYMSDPSDELLAEYLNTGDTYNTTILANYVSNKYELTTYGDFVEQYEKDLNKTIKGELVESMARTLFVTSWADYRENQGESFSQCELMDIAPETPKEMLPIAEKLADTIAKLCSHKHVEGSWLEWCKKANALSELDEFGHYLVMECLGHGVAWTDDRGHNKHNLPLPSICAMMYTGNDNYAHISVSGLDTTKDTWLTGIDPKGFICSNCGNDGHDCACDRCPNCERIVSEYGERTGHCGDCGSQLQK